MNGKTENPPVDQIEVNKVVRILNGKTLKYTLHMLMKDGSERQLQTNYPPKLDFNNEARALMVNVPSEDSEYTSFPVVRFDELALMQLEKNP